MDVWRLKIAAAIALLRHKPPGVGAREYAEKICAEYRQSQETWRTRYLEAQDTILHLKQQLAINQTLREQASPSDCVPTPPPSGAECISDPSAVSSADILSASHQFISSVISITRATKVLDQRPALSSMQDAAAEQARPSYAAQLQQMDFDTLLCQTVPACARQLQMLVSAGGEGVSYTCVMHGLEGLILLLNSDIIDASSNNCKRQLLMHHLGAVVDDIMLSLFDSKDDVQKPYTRDLLHKMLRFLVLKMRTPEKYAVLQSVAEHAKTLTTQLRDSATGSQPMDPCSYERLAVALGCLHQGVSSIKSTEADLQNFREIQTQVEEAVDRSLIQQFPLVAHELFRLSSAIELCIRSACCS